MTAQLPVTLLTAPSLETGVPRYRQIADQLARLIANAIPGMRLPSEHEIARHLGVSRATATQALRDLEQRGLINREQGRGSFAADTQRAVRSMVSGPLPSFSEDLRHAGHTTTEQVSDCDQRAAPAEVATALGLVADERAWQVTRLILSDGEPVIHVTSWLPVARYPRLDQGEIQSSSLYQHLESRYGGRGRPCSADEQWSAQAASRATAAVLRIPVRAPVMRVQRVAFLDDGTAAEYALAHVRGETFVLSFRVANPLDPGAATHRSKGGAR